jgi:hypothetical protein
MIEVREFGVNIGDNEITKLQTWPSDHPDMVQIMKLEKSEGYVLWEGGGRDTGDFWAANEAKRPFESIEEAEAAALTWGPDLFCLSEVNPAWWEKEME